jgi:hypothetical protein
LTLYLEYKVQFSRVPSDTSLMMRIGEVAQRASVKVQTLRLRLPELWMRLHARQPVLWEVLWM